MNATEEWYEVDRLTDRSYAITEAGDYKMFLIEGEDRSVLVDAGAGVGDLRGLVADLVATPITLVLTHTHWDHIGAASGFDDVRVSPRERPPDGRVRLDSISDEFVRSPTQFIDRWTEAGNELPDTFDPETYSIDPADTEPLAVDDPIDLGDRTLEVVELAGHAPGHIGLIDRDTKTLYGGDVVHFDRQLYVMFEDCDLEAYIESMGRVEQLCNEGVIETIATSHNEPFSGEELSIVAELHEGLREIAAGNRDYKHVETKWGEARSYQIGASYVLTKPRE